MSIARWDQTKAVLGGALACADRAEQKAYLDRACGEDPSLRREVESLLSQTTSSLEAGARRAALDPDGAAENSASGRRVGAWSLERELGRGGMGTVWLARRADGRFEQTAAVKLLKRGTDTEEVLRRFRAERQILARLAHPNIARLLDGGETDDGLPFLAMEFVDGVRVTEFAPALNLPQRLELFIQICAGVQYAHQNLVVHRDLKPGNIIVTREGVPKLLDFGIAKLLEDDADGHHTLEGQGRLTPGYASPEQVRGEIVTTASDVYSLGVLLYELLAGQPPYRFSSSRPSPLELARVTDEQIVARPSTVATEPSARRRLGGDLDNIILKALEKSPSRRYPTVSTLAEDLCRHLDGRPVRARPATWGYTSGKFFERNRLGVAMAGLVGLALVGGIAGTLWQARRAERRFDDVRALAHAFLFEFHDSIRDLPGTIPARRLLVSRALEYLGRLANDADGGDASLRRELASAYIQVGDVQGRPNYPNLGDTVGALASYRRAAALAEALPDGDADDDTAALRATAWEALGNLLAGSGQPAEAAELGRRALDFRERAAALRRSDGDRQRALALSLISLADIILASSIAAWDQPAPYGPAVELYQRALTIQKRRHAAEPADPESARELSRVHYRLGNMFFILGSRAPGDRATLERGLEHHRLSVALREEVFAARPASGQARRNLADGLAMKSELQTKLGDAAGALVDCRRAVTLSEGLVAADPENVWARQDLAYAWYCISLPQRALGDQSGALASLDAGIAIYDALSAADPASLTLVAHLNHCLRARTEICATAGDVAGRKASAQRWIATAERLIGANPADPALSGDIERARAALVGVGMRDGG